MLSPEPNLLISTVLKTHKKGQPAGLLLFCIKNDFIYLEAFVNGRMGYASAIAWLLFIIIAILTLVMFKTSRWVFYQDEEN